MFFSCNCWVVFWCAFVDDRELDLSTPRSSKKVATVFLNRWKHVVGKKGGLGKNKINAFQMVKRRSWGRAELLGTLAQDRSLVAKIVCIRGAVISQRYEVYIYFFLIIYLLYMWYIIYIYILIHYCRDVHAVLNVWLTCCYIGEPVVFSLHLTYGYPIPQRYSIVIHMQTSILVSPRRSNLPLPEVTALKTTMKQDIEEAIAVESQACRVGSSTIFSTVQIW